MKKTMSIMNEFSQTYVKTVKKKESNAELYTSLIENLSKELFQLRKEKSEMLSLLDGVTEIVEIYGHGKVDYQKKWCENWLKKANKILHSNCSVDSIY